MGQSIVEISEDCPKPIGLDSFVPQQDGLLLLLADGVETGFAQDLDKESNLLLPSFSRSLMDRSLWRSRTSWYVVATEDNMIAPEQEISMATQINAMTTALSWSHVVMLSHPRDVAQVIEDAAAGAK